MLLPLLARLLLAPYHEAPVAPPVRGAIYVLVTDSVPRLCGAYHDAQQAQQARLQCAQLLGAQVELYAVPIDVMPAESPLGWGAMADSPPSRF